LDRDGERALATPRAVVPNPRSPRTAGALRVCGPSYRDPEVDCFPKTTAPSAAQFACRGPSPATAARSASWAISDSYLTFLERDLRRCANSRVREAAFTDVPRNAGPGCDRCRTHGATRQLAEGHAMHRTLATFQTAHIRPIVASSTHDRTFRRKERREAEEQAQHD